MHGARADGSVAYSRKLSHGKLLGILAVAVAAVDGGDGGVRLIEISNGHIYNLRAHRAYQPGPHHLPADQIGQRCKPRPDGLRVFVRVDAVHGGDGNG